MSHLLDGSGMNLDRVFADEAKSDIRSSKLSRGQSSIEEQVPMSTKAYDELYSKYNDLKKKYNQLKVKYDTLRRDIV